MLIHDFIILLLKLFRVMVVAVLNLLMSCQVVALKFLHARLVLLLELLALLVVMLDHGLVLLVDALELLVHVIDSHLKLMDLIVDVVTAILVMSLGVFSEMLLVELFWLLVDALVLVDVLLVVVMATVTAEAQVDDVDGLVVNEDVYVEDGAAEHHHVVGKKVQVDLRPS